MENVLAPLNTEPSKTLYAVEVGVCIYTSQGECLFTDEGAQALSSTLTPSLQELVTEFVLHNEKRSAHEMATGVRVGLERLATGDVLLKITVSNPIGTTSRLLAFQRHSASFLRSVLSNPVGADFFNSALSHAVELIPAAQSGSILRRASDARFHFAAAHGFDTDLLKEVSFDDQEVYFSEEARAHSFVVTDIEQLNLDLGERRNRILADAGRAAQIQATLVVPLTVEEQTVAFFTLDNFESRDAFTHEDQRLAEMFAVHVAVVLRLLDYHTLFKQVFYNVPYATLILSRDLSVISANATFNRLTGLYAEGEQLGALPLLAPHDVAILKGIKSGGHSWETRLLTKAGGSWCRLNAQHVVLDEPLYLLSLLDLSEVRASEEALQTVIDDLSEEITAFHAETYRVVNNVRSNLAKLQPHSSNSPGSLERLTGRERTLLSHLADGLTNAQIADLLELAPRTVNNNLTMLYKKLGVEGRYQAGLWAKERGL